MGSISGEYDIEEMSELLEDYRSSLYPTLIILPCYSALPAEDQAKIFEPAEPGKRKVRSVFIIFPKIASRVGKTRKFSGL